MGQPIEGGFGHFTKGITHLSLRGVPWEVLPCNIGSRIALETEPRTS